MSETKRTTDIVFVGGGSAGLSGALRARELGLRTVVLEKLGSCGGDAMIAAGFWIAAESKFQKEKGVQDSKAALYRYLMEYSSYRCRPELVRVLVDRCAGNLEWLERQGLVFGKDVHVHGPTTVPRVIQNEGMGAQYVKVLKERAEALGTEILLRTGAESLVMEGGAVVGVIGETEAGERLDVRARGVVLATGGFGKNADMVKKHLPVDRHAMICAGWAKGDNVRLAQEAGAAVEDLNVGLLYKAEMPDTAGLSMRSFYLLLFNNYPVVNRLGERFMDESAWNAYFSYSLKNQPGGSAFVIIDEAMRTANPFTDLSKEIQSGRIKKADSFRDLALQTGLPLETFEATVQRYNAFAAKGEDEEFGKPAASLTPLAKAPYYAIEIVPLVLNTVGGPVIDVKARVLKADGAPIDGLYAAGNGTAGFYDSYPSTGIGLQISSIFGQVAAESVKEAMAYPDGSYVI